MPTFRILAGPWRALPVLGTTQLLAWGAMFYPPVLMLPLVAAERGWSLAFTMGGFSAGLLIGGFSAPSIGRLIDRLGGHVVMTVGALLGAIGLAGLAVVDHPVAYFAMWGVVGIAMAASLYDSAFASLGRIFGVEARRPITLLTFVGGFASTVSWPVTHLLLGSVGWRGTYLVYAVLLAVISAPLLAFVLPRSRAEADRLTTGAAAAPTRVLPASGGPLLLIAAAFAAYAFVPSGLSAHLLAIFGHAGLDRATVVTIGALFGPSQVAARLCEFVFARNQHPLVIARLCLAFLLVAFAMLAVFGLSVATAACFAVMFGIANGLMTISRGTVPLALFGAAGYGRLIGRIAGPSLVMQAAAPLVLAFVAERLSDASALAVVAALTLIALTCFAMVRRPE